MNNLNETIDIIERLAHKEFMFINLQKRPLKYMFGTNNYGEISGTLNKADGDPWDVIVPGYPTLNIDVMHKIKSIEGILLLKNGNHKLIIDIYTDKIRNPFKDIRNESFCYRMLYNRVCHKYGHVILETNMDKLILKIKSFQSM